MPTLDDDYSSTIDIDISCTMCGEVGVGRFIYPHHDNRGLIIGYFFSYHLPGRRLWKAKPDGKERRCDTAEGGRSKKKEMGKEEKRYDNVRDFIRIRIQCVGKVS